MPVYEIGYRSWEGALRARIFRWLVITRTGISLALESKMLRRLLFVAWTPLLYFIPIFFAFGYVTEPGNPIVDSFWYEMLQEMLPRGMIEQIVAHPEQARPAFWAMVFHFFFSYTQSWLTMMVVAIVGPPLIAKDLQNKSFLLYFSKPITNLEYVGGKTSVVLFFISMVTLLPGLFLYAISIAFSPSLGTLLDTWRVVVSIFAAWMLVAVPLSLLVLLLSSLTTDSRIAAFGWMAIWILGEFCYRVLGLTTGLKSSAWIFLLSIRQTTVVLTQSVFDAAGKLAHFTHHQPAGLREALMARIRGGRTFDVETLVALMTPMHSPQTAFLFLAVLSILCWIVLMRRVSAPMRI